MDLSPFRVHCGSGLPAHLPPLSSPGVVSAPAGRREEDSDGSTRTCERRSTGQWDNGPGGEEGTGDPRTRLQIQTRWHSCHPPAPYSQLCVLPSAPGSPSSPSYHPALHPPQRGPFPMPGLRGREGTDRAMWASCSGALPLPCSLGSLRALVFLGVPCRPCSTCDPSLLWLPWATWFPLSPGSPGVPPPLESPGSLSVPLPPLAHFFRGESFLLLQLLSKGQDIQLWVRGKQFCRESRMNDCLHLGQKEEAVSILGQEWPVTQEDQEGK